MAIFFHARKWVFLTTWRFFNGAAPSELFIPFPLKDSIIVEQHSHADGGGSDLCGAAAALCWNRTAAQRSISIVTTRAPPVPPLSQPKRSRQQQLTATASGGSAAGKQLNTIYLHIDPSCGI